MALFRTAHTSDIPALRALWQECFGDSDAFCDWFFAERFAPPLSVVAEEDGRILSAVYGWPYTLRVRGTAIPSLLMCGASTHPAARGRGLMRNCLQIIMRLSRTQGCLIMFQKPVDFAIYRWCDHRACYDAAILTKKEGMPYLPCEGTVDCLCSDTFARELLPVYLSAAEKYSNCIIRSAEDMSLKLRDYAADGGRLLRRDAGSASAYAIYYITDTHLTVPEIMGSPADTIPLLHTLAAMSGNRQFTAKVPADFLPEGFLHDIRPWGAMTVLNAPALLKTICGRSDIAAEITDPILTENNGIFAFDGNPAASAHVRLSSGCLAQLVSGYSDISALVANGDAELLSPCANILAELLPALPCFTVDEY